MNLQNYWFLKHQKYSGQDWITHPSIFAQQVIPYFPSTGSVLDLGAGQGQDSWFFVQKGYRVLATDFSQFALDQIKDPSIQKQLIDFSQTLPFSNNQFDVVYSHMALHYFDKFRTQQLINEIYSVLKPSGIFAALVNSIDDPEVADSKMIKEGLYITPSGLQKRFFSPESFKEFISKFEILQLDNHGETYKDVCKTLVRFVGKKPII